MARKRELFYFRDYFNLFFDSLPRKIQERVTWTLKIIEELDRIPAIYLKHIVGTDGLYEIRIQSGNNVFRLFCFFDEGNLVVIGHGFQKKTQKTPVSEIRKAIDIKKEYYEEKKSDIS